MQPGHSPYYLEMSSFKIYTTSLEGVIVNSLNGVMLKLELYPLKHNMLRMKVTELNPIRPRFEAKEALVGDPEETR